MMTQYLEHQPQLFMYKKRKEKKKWVVSDGEFLPRPAGSAP